MKIIGIDPGKSNGGVAIYDEPTKTWTLARQPDEDQWKEIFQEWADLGQGVLVAIEKQMIRREDQGSPAFFGLQKLVAQTERMTATLRALGVPYVEIYAISWTASWRLPKGKKESKDARKKRYQILAQELVGRKVALWGSDAVLLAHFIQKKRFEDPAWIQERIVNGDENRHIFTEQ